MRKKKKKRKKPSKILNLNNNSTDYIDTNIYEDRGKENEENKDSLNEQEKPKEENKKGHRFRDLKKKLMMMKNDE